MHYFMTALHPSFSFPAGENLPNLEGWMLGGYAPLRFDAIRILPTDSQQIIGHPIEIPTQQPLPRINTEA
jgi:hypothetical protein